MKPEELKEKISKLKMWQRGGQRAPHKPLLFLYKYPLKFLGITWMN
jgi:predicted restriction endonuclease